MQQTESQGMDVVVNCSYDKALSVKTGGLD